MTLLNLLEYIGTVAFSISGAMVAIENKMDIFGVIMLGLTTAVGGGMLRDVILGVNPPSIFDNYFTIFLAIITAVVCFLPRIRKYIKKADITIQVMDAIGLAIFTIVGVETSISYNNVLLSVFVGTLTGVGGGALRDIFAHNDLYIFTKHFYACASIIGAVVCFYLFKIDDNLSILISFTVVFALRMCAMKYKWNLPKAK